eukprot:Phypoly_transcript_05603.p1 GENE.Phypoly_transcript_05603~~Phypoly_transcript_05603.p1  ORF type:complete len:531 (+),score=105.12 Phypoly_transcript_05603:28-1593(+)
MSITQADVAKHNNEKDCWIVIDNKVYDVTKFAVEHPGGKKVLQKVAGKDASAEFHKFHNPTEVLNKYGPSLYVGDLAQPNKSDAGNKTKQEGTKKESDTFGCGVPYGEPNWYQGWNSNYFRPSHYKVRAAIREFVERELMPFAGDWDEGRTPIPREMWNKFAAAGIFAATSSSQWPTEFVGPCVIAGVPVDDFDAFHQLIVTDELARISSSGVLSALQIGPSISLPPVTHFAKPNIREQVCRDVLNGNKRISLCITEPSAGSDVANLTATATKSPDGKHYIINGEKKWITGGMYADYFTVAARTGGAGMAGISLFLVPRGPGVTTRQLKLQGNWAAGTAYVTFENVEVPAENLIGEENHGFKYIMFNFNSERWGIIVQGIRVARVQFEEAFKYAHKRKTFGKRLVDHPVIRLKLAHMARQIEASQAWLESVTYQLCTMNPLEAATKLGGPMALLKAQATTTLEFCAREASQIFGGLAYTRGGQGEKVERAYREVRGFAIPGGSEEIMLDLGIRMAMRQAKL